MNIKNILENAREKREQKESGLVDTVEDIKGHLENFVESIESNIERIRDDEDYDSEDLLFDTIALTSSFASMGTDMKNKLKAEFTQYLRRDGLADGLESIYEKQQNKEGGDNSEPPSDS